MSTRIDTRVGERRTRGLQQNLRVGRKLEAGHRDTRRDVRVIAEMLNPLTRMLAAFKQMALLHASRSFQLHLRAGIRVLSKLRSLLIGAGPA